MDAMFVKDLGPLLSGDSLFDMACRECGSVYTPTVNAAGKRSDVCLDEECQEANRRRRAARYIYTLVDSRQRRAA